ncbi:long-chain-fatty-acid--CoA ligase [Peribacillus kribbensis]|uniref:long-chain-fatty-acid--CoA ligase n=1 Tax=Peribacillus kribbensis TaxID=356658 RepID=UPI000415FA18|nr:long-chain-fatty-acid--CoA ligase [Peribacillus kribbensis]
MEKIWIKNYPEKIPSSLEYIDQPLQFYLSSSARKHPDKCAIHFMGRKLSFKQVYDSALKFAHYLRGLGVNKGDRVAIMLPNTPQSVIAYFGSLIAGAVVVQTNPLYMERELEYQMKDSGAKVILTLDILFPRAEKVLPQTNLEHIIVTAIKDFLPFPKNLIYPFIQKKQYNMVVNVEHEGNYHLFTEIMKQEAKGEWELGLDVNEDLALLQYTGGTTGFPKGVMLTHKNLVSNAQMCSAWLYKDSDENRNILGILPFFHVFGMTTVMILSIMEGCRMTLLPKFDVLTALKTIQKEKPTLFPGAPTMYIGLLNHPKLKDYDLSSIKACISGSAPLPIEVQDKFEALTGGKLVEGYGLTETSPVTHANFLWDRPRVKGSIGVPWPDTEAAILSAENGEELGPKEIGELAIKGPQVMKGYWNRPEDTAETFKNGWLLTGDIGYYDEDGYFYIVDRKKDMIIAGGFNIYPREIEEILYEHEAVLEAAVAGVPDPYRGETVKAFIVLKEGKTVTEQDMDAFVRKHLAAYKVPRIYEFRSSLPKTAVGKILRRILIEEEKKKLDDQKNA